MNLFSLFQQAEKNLTRPKLIFPVSDSQQIHVALCTKRNLPDFLNYLYLYLVEHNKIPGTYLGKVTKKNELVLSPAIYSDKTGLKDTIIKMFSNPQPICSMQGRRFSFCCFCGTKIESKDSLAVGYGPICAEKWGLPWGETTTILSRVGNALKDEIANNSETDHR